MRIFAPTTWPSPDGNAVHGCSRITDTEVPVVDALTAGTRLAGVMARVNADLGVRACEAHAYRGPNPATRAAGLETFLQRHRGATET